MCWKSYKHSDKKCHIAETDIKTFKILSLRKHTLYAYYRNYNYTIGKINSVNSLELIEDTISEGFHSYDINNDYLSVLSGIVVLGKNTGLLDYYSYEYNIVKVECTIPKGSIYYRNFCGEIVSDKLIVDSIVYIFQNETKTEKVSILE